MNSPMPGTSKTSSPASPSPGPSTSRTRKGITRSRKRKRISSESSSDTETVLPENLLEVEKNVHAAAVKNKLDDVSVKKILKTVVTNDHVLALVKLQEEEQNAMETDNPRPKLTRAKVKELKKVTPKTAWNLDAMPLNMELSPIKRIAVKTRPEVTALIAHDMPEDEDDEEYQPTLDDVPSDDDHTLESCSDVDSQPRTPATPRRAASPRVVKDGPFKVPQMPGSGSRLRGMKIWGASTQEVSTPRRRPDADEDATIALRTRSKLSLSSIPIDHIEGSFVPPDELPAPADDVWTDFLQICLNPDTEDADDDDDPEYNAAEDPDAHDEDEEGLENIIKISKKELNDLVTELFSVMPEDVLSGKLAGEPPARNTDKIQSTSWEGKQELVSDEETPTTPAVPQTRETRLSIGKSKVISDSECQGESEKENRESDEVARPAPPTTVTMSVLEREIDVYPADAGSAAPPAPLQSLLVEKQTLTVQVQPGAKVLPEQIEILQQQLRQHIQLAASNFLQLYVHPVHWTYAPNYKEYLETLHTMTLDNPKSVTNVCNLKPAIDLIGSWAKSVSEDTPENKKMIEFVQGEIERGRRRAAQNALYIGNFHEMFLNVISNSPVFLYPHLLPSTPYRSDGVRKFNYLRSEDALIALGMEQFWSYVDNNPDLFKLRQGTSVHRGGLINAVHLVCKHMVPWMSPKALMNHIKHIKKHTKSNQDNPIKKFLATGEVTPVKHELLPFNQNLTLYEQPENEMPRIWIKHLAKRSQRFQDHIFRRTTLFNRVGMQPAGVPVNLGTAVQPLTKKPLPRGFIKEVATSQPANTADKFDAELTPPTTQNVMYSVIQTPTGALLLPVTLVTTADGTTTPISLEVNEPISNSLPEESNVPSTVSVIIPIKNNTQVGNSKHCACCIRLRKISKRQSLITDFFKTPNQRSCPCKVKRKFKYPNVTKKLRLLVSNYKSSSSIAWQGLTSQMKALMSEMRQGTKSQMVSMPYSLDEIAAVTSFQLRLTIQSNIARNIYTKRRIHSLMAKFKPDTDDIYSFTAQVEKILGAEAVDVYNEFLGFLTMEQADKIGMYSEYFKQKYLTSFMKKVEELVPYKQHKHNILSGVFKTLSSPAMATCDICSSLLDACSRYPALADYVFSLFPHTRRPLCIEKEKIPAPTAKSNNAPKRRAGPKLRSDTRAKDNVEENNSDAQTRDNSKDAEGTDNVQERREDSEATNHTEEHRKDAESIENIEKHTKQSEGTNNIEHSVDAEATDSIEHSNDAEATDNIEHSNDAEVTDNIEHSNDAEVTDNIEHSNDAEATDNIEGSIAQAIDNVEDEPDPITRGSPEDEPMDYEADHSDSDDDGNQILTIVEDPEEVDQAQRNHLKNVQHVSENVIDTPHLPITKTEIQDPSDSDMSMMSEDESSIVKTEPVEWKRDEDRRLLEVLQKSLTQEEIKDKTILEIIEQKKVLKLAAEELPEKSLDDVRARILYLLVFLVASEHMTNKE